MSAYNFNELYMKAYNNVRSDSRSAIINGYNQFEELEKLAVREPLALSEIRFNKALAARQLQDLSLFKTITNNSADVRIAQLEQLLQHDIEEKASSEQSIKNTKRLVQQISCCLLGSSALIFMYRGY